MSMMPPPYGAFGPAGPKQFRESDLETEIKIPKQATKIIILAGEGAVLLCELLLLVYHKLALSILGLVICAAIAALMCRWARLELRSFFWRIFFGLAVVGVPVTLGLGGLAWAELVAGWASLTLFAQDLGRLLGEALAPLLGLHWIAYALALSGCTVAALKGKRQGRVALVAAGLATALYLWAAARAARQAHPWIVPPRMRWSRLAYAWARLKWLLLPYAWPALGAALALVAAMAKELFWPAFEHSLQPLKWDDFVAAGGLLGLFFPRRKDQPKGQIVAMDVYHKAPKGIPGVSSPYRKIRIPEPKRPKHGGMAGFALGILNGTATFSEAGGKGQHGAMVFGYTQGQYRNELRPAVIDHGYAQDGAEGGVIWTDAGYSWLVQRVERDVGLHAVPEQYLDYSTVGREGFVIPGDDGDGESVPVRDDERETGDEPADTEESSAGLNEEGTSDGPSVRASVRGNGHGTDENGPTDAEESRGGQNGEEKGST